MQWCFYVKWNLIMLGHIIEHPLQKICDLKSKEIALQINVLLLLLCPYTTWINAVIYFIVAIGLVAPLIFSYTKIYLSPGQGHASNKTMQGIKISKHRTGGKFY